MRMLCVYESGKLLYYSKSEHNRLFRRGILNPNDDIFSLLYFSEMRQRRQLHMSMIWSQCFRLRKTFNQHEITQYKYILLLTRYATFI